MSVIFPLKGPDCRTTWMLEREAHKINDTKQTLVLSAVMCYHTSMTAAEKITKDPYSHKRCIRSRQPHNNHLKVAALYTYFSAYISTP